VDAITYMFFFAFTLRPRLRQT